MNYVSITNEQVVCLPHVNIYYSTKLFTFIFICKWIRVQANGFKRHKNLSVHVPKQTHHVIFVEATTSKTRINAKNYWSTYKSYSTTP
jgi:hypothetical protein